MYVITQMIGVNEGSERIKTFTAILGGGRRNKNCQ